MIDEIKARRHRGQSYKEIWQANTYKAVAAEIGMRASNLQRALTSSRPQRMLSDSQVQKYRERIELGKAAFREYTKDSDDAICKDFGITHRRLQKIMKSDELGGAERFLTMRLSRSPAQVQGYY